MWGQAASQHGLFSHLPPFLPPRLGAARSHQRARDQAGHGQAGGAQPGRSPGSGCPPGAGPQGGRWGLCVHNLVCMGVECVGCRDQLHCAWYTAVRCCLLHRPPSLLLCRWAWLSRASRAASSRASMATWTAGSSRTAPARPRRYSFAWSATKPSAHSSPSPSGWCARAPPRRGTPSTCAGWGAGAWGAASVWRQAQAGGLLKVNTRWPTCMCCTRWHRACLPVCAAGVGAGPRIRCRGGPRVPAPRRRGQAGAAPGGGGAAAGWWHGKRALAGCAASPWLKQLEGCIQST